MAEEKDDEYDLNDSFINDGDKFSESNDNLEVKKVIGGLRNFKK